MATQEDIDRITQLAEHTEDLAQLKGYRQELLSIAANMANVIAQTSDSGVQEQAGEIKQSAEYGADEIGARARQLEIDQMDPDYERRKGERAAFAEQEQQRQAQEAQEGMKKLQGLLGGLGGGGGAAGGAGLGGLLGGLFGGKGGQQEAEAGTGTAPGAARSETPPVPPPQPPPSPTPQPPPIPAPQPGGSGAVATMACKSCGAQVKVGAKFCPECGTQNPTVNACTGCGQTLEGTPKFCPNCGTPTAA